VHIDRAGREARRSRADHLPLLFNDEPGPPPTFESRIGTLTRAPPELARPPLRARAPLGRARLRTAPRRLVRPAPPSSHLPLQLIAGSGASWSCPSFAGAPTWTAVLAAALRIPPQNVRNFAAPGASAMRDLRGQLAAFAAGSAPPPESTLYGMRPTLP
jgi:hypothetical protein